MRRLIILFFFVLVFGGCAGGEPDHNVLFIGNSYTHYNDMPSMVEKIADANGVNVSTTMITRDGAFLDEHLVNPNVLAALSSGEYDIVVLQEQSVAPSDASFTASRTKPAALALSSLANAGGARVVWYQTWGRLNGFPEVGHANYEAMQTAITRTYDEIGVSAGGSVARAGQRWQRILASGQNIVVYASDGSHPTSAGSYVAAIEITEAVIDPFITVAPSVSGVDDETAAAIFAS